MAKEAPTAGTVPPSRTRPRHWLVLLGFLLMVIAPTLVAGWYLWTRASDRYVSTVGFAIRTEETGSALEMLGGIASLSGASSDDTEILYKFIQSQELVSAIEKQVDLRAMWEKGDPRKDPIFAYHPPGTIEDLVSYWQRRVKVYNDDNGLLELRVEAFTPEDAHKLAELIYDESSQMINRLSAIAREDTTRYARDEVEQAVERLKQARQALTEFRNRTQIIDPGASVQSQMGLLSSLQMQLSEALIDLDIQRETASANDPRVVQLQRRVSVIEARIAKEREKLGLGSDTAGGDSAFADLVGEFERLNVDQQFAEQSYTAALTAYDSAVAEARRKSRYLAAYVRPTLPQSPAYPNRPMLLFLVGLFSFLAWAILVLALYAIRDRR